MPNPPKSREEALESLERKLKAFEVKKDSQASSGAARQLSQGYRLVWELIGGVLGGIGFGWLFDQVAHTAPWGMVGGLVIGTGISTVMVVRMAGRLSDEASKAAPPPAPLDDEDEDE
ncbi:MAG TPA: AtpZ/AtpI family protein [Caulobacteraceae bacterium]